LYGQYYTEEEIDELVEHAVEYDLEDEIAALRIRISRIMKQLEEKMTTEEYARLTDLQFKGSSTIARLMRAQRAISGEAAEGISGAIGQALDEMANEWRIDL
jgi:hypothetical protein